MKSRNKIIKIPSIFFKIFVFFGVCFNSYADKYKYLVYFTDKDGSKFSLDKPEQFLGKRAILRRSKQNIPIRYLDLPVVNTYLDSLQSFVDVNIWYTSRWFNAAYIQADSATVSTYIKNLKFVKKIEILKNITDTIKLNSSTERKLPKNQKFRLSGSDYGQSLNQTSMLCADYMHNQGFSGEGKIIAIMDGGFNRAKNMYYFDSLFQNNNVLGGYDFVNNNSNPFAYSDHGTQVLSCIAGYAKGSLIGTAPHAQFYLFRTEEEATEYPVEEANWLIAAERADSLGVDIINSSLGYSTFDDKSLNHTYKDMNGKTTIISRAAAMAASTGMLCVISAGNNGADRWKYISAPADADSILAVGAVNSEGVPGRFSGYGPSSDGRIKPDVAAMGVSAIVGKTNNEIGSGNGTSFAAPILCGMVAGLWQSLPDLTNLQIIELVKKSASKYSNPDDRVGYGIPCYTKARLAANGKSVVAITDTYVVPNPFFEGNLDLMLGSKDVDKFITVSFYDVSGKIVFNQNIEHSKINNPLNINQNLLNSGLYFVRVSASDFTRIIKLEVL